MVQVYLTDLHPLEYLRANVNLQMIGEFYDTYDVKEGDGMYLPKEERIHFWGGYGIDFGEDGINFGLSGQL